MKLTDKIQNAHSNKLSDYSKIYTPTAEVIEGIVDEFVIEFAEWAIDYSFNGMYSNDLKELLEEFKKEKGL